MEEKEIIELCKKEFAQKFKLSYNELTQRDFEFLHDKILELTKVSISTATLRRLWFNNYQNVPQISTLNALAQCLGYVNWHEYKIKCATTPTKPFRWFLITKKYALISLVPFFILAVWYFTTENNTGNVYLKAESKTHIGVPATIGFHYSIEGVSDAEIQLSWNPYERTKLDPQKNFYTGTYFYPDYHEAKIIADKKVIASEYVHITSEGWHGLIMQEGYDIDPTYLDEQNFINGDVMTVTDSTALKNNLNLLEYFPVFTLSNSELDSLSGDNFSLSCQLKLHESEITRNCRSIDILIKGETGNIRIPIGEIGCYGLYQLSVSEKIISGKTTDLSSLTADLSFTIPINITSSSHQLTVKVGNNDEFMAHYTKSIGDIKVVKFVLTGAGEISRFKLLSNSPM